jgi:sec-independent protein translocase protein TatC
MKKHWNELIFRLFYCLIAIVLSIMVSFIYSETLLYIMAKPIIEARFKISLSLMEMLNKKNLMDDNMVVLKNNLDGMNNFESVTNIIEMKRELLNSIILFLSEKSDFIYTHIAEAFLSYICISLYVGFFISLFYVIYQFYFFLKPGLFKNELNLYKIFFIWFLIFFIIGNLFMYYILFPLACKFFISMPNSYNGLSIINIQLNAKIYEYIHFYITWSIIIGLLLQFPIFFYFLRIQIDRKLVLILSLIIGAILSPPDVLSQLLLALPVFICYELTCFFIFYMDKLVYILKSTK